MANQVSTDELRTQLAAEDPLVRASSAEAAQTFSSVAVPLLQTLLAAAVDTRSLNAGQRDYSAPAAAAAALEALGPLVAPALPELRKTIGTLNDSISFLRGFDDDEYKDVETAKDAATVRDAVSELGTSSGARISSTALQALLRAACVDGPKKVLGRGCGGARKVG
jgi:hypothetical protein